MTLIDAPGILVFAGPNGSGKSTITQAWEKVGLYINADDIKVLRSRRRVQGRMLSLQRTISTTTPTTAENC